MAKNTITLEIPQLEGIAEKLDRIIAALERPAPKCESCADDVAEFVADQLQQAGLAPTQDTQPTADTTPEEKPAEAQETAKTEPTVTRADIQKKVVALSAAGKKAAVKQIVTAYENTKVSDIPEDKLGEVWQKLTALEG